MSCCAGSLPAAFATESTRQSELLQLENIKQSARTLADGTFLLRLNVPDVHCGACISTIERRLAKLNGVQTARVNLTLRQLTVTVKDLGVLIEVLTALDQLGYKHHVATDSEHADPALKGLLRSLAVSGFAATNVMLLSVSVWNGAEDATRGLFHFISALIALPAIAYAGQPFFISAVQALRHHRMNMDVPISLGVLLATGMSVYESIIGGGHAYFDAALSLLFFLLIGRTLDLLMRGRARQLVTRMAALSAKGGMRIMENGQLAYVPQEDIAPDMLLRVASGERLPADAVIIIGTSVVDRSLVTGECAPASVMPGTQLESGVLNLSSPLEVKVLRSGAHSFLGEVTQMLAAAEEGRGHYVRLADRMARIYSPAVHVLALLTFAAWMFATSGDWHASLTTAVAVLIITCPCALGLAVPVAHVVAASCLFKHGILVKDGSALERLAEINHVAFDKTGTLTDGQLKISHCAIPHGEHAAIAKAMALASRHPAAQSLARHLGIVPSVALQAATEVPGFGIEAQCNGTVCRLGRASWVAEITANNVEGSGLAFGSNLGPLFTVGFRENLRPNAADVLKLLTNQNIGSEILSGDSIAAVAAVANRLGISGYCAALTPARKVERLMQLAAQGRKVMMVGDGLNDAPALAAAHVSIAPASASDIGRNAADLVFMGEGLSAVTDAHRTAIRAKRIVQQNFALAALYNALAVPLAMAGYLNPLLAAVAMSTSSLIVVGNSLRLHEWKWQGIDASYSPTPSFKQVTQ